MKATELRLGNLIYGINRRGEVHLPDEIPLKVLQIELFNCEVLPYEENPAQKETYFKISHADTSGIPLTEKWLLKFGFEDKSTVNRFADKITHPIFPLALIQSIYKTFRLSPDNFSFPLPGDTSKLIISNELKYVHQLQNLYYALTGEELKIHQEVV